MEAKRDTAYGEKPEAVKTHLRNMVIVPLGGLVINPLQTQPGIPKVLVVKENVQNRSWPYYFTTSNKKLLVAPGLTTSNKRLLISRLLF